MLRLSIPIVLSFFLLSIKTQAQEVFLFSGVYNINSSANKVKYDNGKYNVNDINQFVGSIGSFVDFKSFTLYGECVVTHSSNTFESKYLATNTLANTNEVYSSTLLKPRLGIGTRMEATKHLRIRFVSYLGYEYSRRKDYAVRLSYNGTNHKISKREESEKPEDSTIELGVKCLAEYQCLKSLYLGVGLDFNYFLYQEKGYATFKSYQYNINDEIEDSIIKDNKYNERRFGTSFLNVNLYVNYRL